MDKPTEEGGLIELATFLKEGAITMPEFKVAPFYDITDNAIILYFKNKRSHEVRLSEEVSLFVSADDNKEVVGVEVRYIDEIKTRFPRINKVDQETMDEILALAKENGVEGITRYNLTDGLPTE